MRDGSRFEPQHGQLAERGLMVEATGHLAAVRRDRAVVLAEELHVLTPPLVDADGMLRDRASTYDCEACALKPRCCPTASARKIQGSIHEGARQMARDICASEAVRIWRRERRKVEMLFAHLKRIRRLDRLRLRGADGARDEFDLAAAALNLRTLARLIPFGQPSLA